jgi:hypothetical protein
MMNCKKKKPELAYAGLIAHNKLQFIKTITNFTEATICKIVFIYLQFKVSFVLFKNTFNW